MTFDYLIVGGGSAGCVLANRLSAGGQHRVCLLEAGPSDRSPFIKMPGGIIPLLRSDRYNWKFWTAPEPAMGGRRMFWPRGRTLGGSSSINAMCYIRGHAQDYDQWAEAGNPGWSYKEVLPYFRLAENYEPGADDYHGAGGPLNVADLRHHNPLSQMFLAAAQQAGYAETPDFNGPQQEGMGLYRVMQKGGERCSNARAYLREAEQRANVTVLTDAHATRVLMDGKRAVGVRVYQNGRYVDLRAQREVVLAAGAIGSPQLLQLSGIGAAAELQRLGLTVVQDLPGVGENLQDHLDIHVTMRNPTRLAVSLHPLSLLRALRELLRYLFFRRGELTSNIAEAGGFLKSGPTETIPDLQMHFVPIVSASHGQDLSKLQRHYGYTLMTCFLRPKSRGRVRLHNLDPLAAPDIQANYCDHPEDLEKLVTGLKLARKILAQPAFGEHAGAELEPGAEVQSDDDIRAWARANAETIYHPVGTCRMGQDAQAVVDARLRVHGLSGLRVIDASVMPTLVGGNTNAPTTMIAEKGAAMMLADLHPLPEAAGA